MNNLEIRQPDDFHVHLRYGQMLKLVLPYTASVFARAVVMPNLTEQGMVLNAEHIALYRQLIMNKASEAKCFGFIPLMTVRITPQTTMEIMSDVIFADVMVGKLYPDGVTTGAQGGVRDFKSLYKLFSFMQENDLILSIHCELPDVPALRAEQAFIPVLSDIVKNFPRLRIVVEHVSTKEMVEFVCDESADYVAATITPQHLKLTINDVIGNAHNFCKPIAKTEKDRAALITAATSGNPRFFLGTDSAPHPIERKECSRPATGVFCAPVALPLLAQIFEEADALDRLEDFTSRFGAEFYRLPLNQKTICLQKKSWQVGTCFGDGDFPVVVPFLTGQTLDWQIKQVD